MGLVPSPLESLPLKLIVVPTLGSVGEYVNAALAADAPTVTVFTVCAVCPTSSVMVRTTE